NEARGAGRDLPRGVHNEPARCDVRMLAGHLERHAPRSARAAEPAHRRLDGNRDDRLGRLSRDQRGRTIQPRYGHLGPDLDGSQRPVAAASTHRRLDRFRNDYLGRQQRNIIRRDEHGWALQPGDGYLGSYVDRYQCPRAAVWTHRRVDGDRDDHLERLSRNEHGRPVRPLDRYVDSYLDRLARPGGPGWSHGRLDRDGDDHLGRSRSNQRRLREYRGTLQTGERQVGRHV